LSPPTPQTDPPAFTDLLHRPADQRRREYQYRFAQSAVFGLPVLALQFFGRSIGGPEADRWVAVLQLLLGGWVVYVGAVGMAFEGAVWLMRRRLSADLIPAAVAILLYLAALARLVAFVLSSSAGPFPRGWIHWAVTLLIVWTGVRWWQFARRTGSAPHEKKEPRGPCGRRGS
jgi:hypothetical protein